MQDTKETTKESERPASPRNLAAMLSVVAAIAAAPESGDQAAGIKA